MKSILIAFSLVCIASCQTEEITSFEPSPYFECYDEESLSKAELAASLVGTWDWQYISCFWTPGEANSTACENCSLVFHSNGDFEFFEGTVEAESGTWNLEDSFSAGYFNIKTEPFLEWALGQVYLCNDQLLFFNSYIDGCDNYFKS